MIEPLESRIAPAFASIVDVALVDGDNGFQISRAVPAMPDGFANALVGIGNINHDGFDDFAISAAGMGASAGAGSVYVIFGNSDFNPNLDVATLNGTNGFRIDGLAAGDMTGARVSPAGDFNKDGNDDFMFSAPNAGNDKGACFLILGQATAFPAVLSLASPTGVSIVQFNGELAGDRAGASVSGAGDFNKDGYDDIIIGAPGAAAGLGAGYVVFGLAGTGSAVFSLSGVNGNNGFRLLSDLNHVATGRDVAGVGDLNNDGYDDLAIGSASAGPAPTSTSYIVLGNEGTAASRALASLDGTNGFKINAGVFPGRGQHLAAAGDINDDGFDDFLLTTALVKRHGIHAAAFAIFGHATPFDATLKLNGLDGTNGFRVDFGKFKHLNFSSVSAAGDVNSDGIADFMVGSAGFRGKPVAGVDADNGTSYVIFGHEGAFAKVFDAAVLEIGGGFTIQNAPATPFFVTDVGPAGDVNGDSFDDIIIGSGKPGDLGAGYVLFGQPVYIATDPASDAVKFSDADGDVVTVEVGGHKLTQNNFTFSDPSPFHAHGASASSASVAYFGVELDNSFANSVVKINAQAMTGGDGLTHVGFISAPGYALKKIKVIGDVDSISVGDSAAPAGTNAIGTLDVRTLGPATGVGQSTVLGGVNLLKVRGEMRNTTLSVGNDLASGLKRMVVTGDVSNSHVSSTGKLRMTVNGDVTDSTFDAATFIRAFTITGDLVNTTIRAVGDASTVETAATPAIKKLVVKGSVENSHILAGYDPLGVLTNGHAGIHKIIVKHDWTASDLVAGVAAGTDTFFGTADDTALGGGGFTLPSRIDSISITGQLFGTATAGDQFGFVAEEIGRFKVGGADLIAFTPGANNDLGIFTFATTNDVSLHEVAAPV